MNKKRLWTRGVAWLLTLCLLAGLCVPTVRAEEETEPSTDDLTDVVETTDEEDSVSYPVSPMTADQGETSLTLGVDNLECQYTFKNSNSSNNATLDISADANNHSVSAKIKSGAKRRIYYPGTLQIKLKSTYPGTATLSFSCKRDSALAFAADNGEVKIAYKGQETTANDYSFNGNLAQGEEVILIVTSGDYLDASTLGVSVSISSIKLEPYVASATTQFLAPVGGGSYSVTAADTGETVTFSADSVAWEHTMKSNQAYHLKATPENDDWIFAGWLTKSGDYIGDRKVEYDFYTETDTTIQAVFVKKDSAIFGVSTRQFYKLYEANAYAQNNGGTIVLLKGGTVNEAETEISKGVTLLIPFSDNATVHTTNPQTNKTQTKPSVFRSLILANGNKLIVRSGGAICVDSEVIEQKAYPVGPYGLLTLQQDAELVLESGSNLYCWGYVNGAGQVTAQSGSNVYECFQLAGWRGGNATTAMVDKKQKVFPLNQYYIQNIESTFVMYAGANENVSSSVTVSGVKAYTKTPAVFIGQDTGMFRLRTGKLTRKFDSTQDRMTYIVQGDLKIGSMNIKLELDTWISLPGVTDTKLVTQKYVLPITNNLTIDIQSGTTTMIAEQELALLPGVEFIVSKEATLKVACSLHVYDKEAWVGKKFASASGDLITAYYNTSGKASPRTSAKLEDAVIDVNGVLDVTGTIYTTKVLDTDGKTNVGGANIYSSKGTGIVKFANQVTTDEKTAYQVTQSGNEVSYVDVYLTPAKLKNADTAKPYTETSGAPAGSVYYYDVDEFGNGSKNWYRFNVTYVINGTSDTKQLNTETKLSDVTIDGTIESVTATVNGGQTVLENVSLSQDNYDSTNKTLDISKILTAVQEYDAKNGYKNMGNVTISITTNNKGSSHPMFVLSAKQLRIYQSFGGTATFTELTGDMKGYYLVKDITDPEKQIGGTPCTADDVDMPVPDYDKFGWYMGEGSDAQEFGNVVPGLDGRVVYIYGRYSGYAVEMDYPVLTHPSNYYTTIAEAMSYVTDVGNITYTLKMLADNDAFGGDGGKYTIPANRGITLNLNGFTVTGTITNKGTLTIQDSTHSETNDGTGKVTSASNNTITNAGTLTLESGKFVSTGGATAVYSTSGTLNIGTGAAFSGKNAASSNVIKVSSGKANYPDGYQLSTSLVDGYFRVVLAEVTITWIDGDGNKTTSQVKQGEVPKYPGTENPVKTPRAGENCKYKFTGWKPELTAATEDAEYTAQFGTIDKIRMTSGDTVDYFNTLQEAIDQSPEGATLTLQKTLDAASGTAAFTKTLTLDLNGQTSSGNITVNNGVTLTIKGTGGISASGTAIRNNGTLILTDGITVNATGNNSIALDNSGTIDSITGGTFTGHVAVQIESGGKIGSITGGTFSADAGNTVINNLSTNPVKLSGDPKFGGVTYYEQVLNGVTDTSKFTFEPNMTISTSKNSAGYFTIVANTFTLVFNVDGKLTTKTGVSRAGDVDLSSLYGADPAKDKDGYEFAGWSLTQNGAALETKVTQTQLGTPGTGDTVTVYATWNVVYSVTITWGSLEYDYKGATYVWDGQSMKYKVQTEAHWESVDTNNTVKVTNNTVATEGTVQVKAKYEKNEGYSFDLLQNGTSLTTEQKLGDVASKGSNKTNTASWSFSLSGTPSGNAFTKVTVGKITLTLQPAT